MGKTSKINMFLFESRTPMTKGAVDSAQASLQAFRDIIQEKSIPHSDVKCHFKRNSVALFHL